MEPEVRNAGVVVRFEEDVGGLNVAMDDLLRHVEVGQASGCPYCDSHPTVPVQWSPTRTSTSCIPSHRKSSSDYHITGVKPKIKNKIKKTKPNQYVIDYSHKMFFFKGKKYWGKKKIFVLVLLHLSVEILELAFSFSFWTIGLSLSHFLVPATGLSEKKQKLWPGKNEKREQK